MKNIVWRIAIVVLVAAFYIARYHRSGSNGTIDYRGQQFKTARAYETYEDYKDDPNNLDTNEPERIENAMVEAKFPTNFSSRKEFFHALFDLKFPGYGLGGIGAKPQTDDGSTLVVESVEIPQRDKDRYLVVRDSGDHLVLLDDFISSTATNMIRRVKLQGSKLFYYAADGFVVREKQLSAQ